MSFRWHCSFDELVGSSGVTCFPTTRELEPDIVLDNLTISDTPDDFVVLEDAVLGHFAGMIWRDRWLAPAVHYMPESWHHAPWLPGVLASDGAGIELRPEVGVGAEIVSDPGMLIDTFVGATNFGHTIHDTLPYGLLFRRARSLVKGLRPIITPFKYAKQREIFSIVFDYPYDECIFLKGTSCFRQLVLARRQTVFNNSQGHPAGRYKTSFAGFRHARDSLLERFQLSGNQLPSGKGGGRCIYLHRISNVNELREKNLLQGRNFCNQWNLIETLMEHGFVIMEPGHCELDVIGDFLSDAETVMGIHGAQLANIIFCRPGTKLYEIRSYSGVWRSLEAIAATLGLDHVSVVQPRPENPDEPELDVANIVNLLEFDMEKSHRRPLTLTDLNSTSWRFMRGGGQEIAPRLRLQSGGEIEDYRHPNEHTWKLVDGRLALVGRNGETTSEFFGVEFDGDCPVTLIGRHTFDHKAVLILRLNRG